MSIIPFASISNRTSKSILVCFHWSIEILLAIISTLNYSPASFPIKYTLGPFWFQPFSWLKIILSSEFLFFELNLDLEKAIFGLLASVIDIFHENFMTRDW